MALTEDVVIDQIEILENGTIQVRQAARVYRDGVKIAETFNRHCLAPGDDLAGQDSKVAAVAGLIHTKEVIDAHKAALAAVPGMPKEKI